jgi:hypothetical protein
MLMHVDFKSANPASPCREVKELQQALSKVHREKGQSLKATMSLEVGKVRSQVNGLRRKVDEARSRTRERAAEVERLTDRFREVEKLAAPPIDDDSPLARKIRTLENRLDKAMIKYNESQRCGAKSMGIAGVVCSWGDFFFVIITAGGTFFLFVMGPFLCCHGDFFFVVMGTFCFGGGRRLSRVKSRLR